MFIWLNAARTGLAGYELFGVRVAVTFGVAVASYHLVERPIRQGSFFRQWRAWVAAPVSVGAVVAAVVSVSYTHLAIARGRLHRRVQAGTGDTL